MTDDTVQVRLLTSVAGPGIEWDHGDIIEMPRDAAEDWCRRMAAEPVEERVDVPAGRLAVDPPVGDQAVDVPGGDQAVDEPDGRQASGGEHVCAVCGFEAKTAAGLGGHRRSHT